MLDTEPLRVDPLPKYDAMKVFGGVEVNFHVFLALTLDGGEWSVSNLNYFIFGEEFLRLIL
jgi:hypothetical protein